MNENPTNFSLCYRCGDCVSEHQLLLCQICLLHFCRNCMVITYINDNACFDCRELDDYLKKKGPDI